MNEEVLHEKPLVVHDTEHVAHEPHHQSFITKYIFSQDHKMIAKQYVLTGIIWAVIGSAIFTFIVALLRRAFTGVR